MMGSNGLMRVFWPLDFPRNGQPGVIVGWRNSELDVLVVAILEDIDVGVSAAHHGYYYHYYHYKKGLSDLTWSGVEQEDRKRTADRNAVPEISSLCSKDV